MPSPSSKPTEYKAEVVVIVTFDLNGCKLNQDMVKGMIVDAVGSIGHDTIDGGPSVKKVSCTITAGRAILPKSERKWK